MRKVNSVTKKKTGYTTNKEGKKTTQTRKKQSTTTRSRESQSRNTRTSTQNRNTKSGNTQTRTAKRSSGRKKLKKKKGLHRKKTSLRTRRLIALVCTILILIVVGFIGKKTVSFVSSIWPNIESVKNSLTGGKIDKTNVDTSDQYDINDEKQPTLEAKHNIFIDVGCGGNETGYVTKDNVKEKDLDLEIAKLVAKQLSKYDDVNVILSRQEDVYMSADERKSLAENQNAELFVSIHMAGENTGKADGVETIYYKGSQNGSYDFASLMQTSIMAFIKAENRGTSAYEMSVLKDNSMPSIYIQCGFLSNSAEKKKLTDKEYQQELAKGIAQGILSYIDAKK